MDSKAVWYKKISVKTALLVWSIIVFTLLIFIIGTLPSQQKILYDRMNSEANDISSSIGQVTSTAIINNDYAFTVDHCLEIIKNSKSIIYIKIIKNDGFALVHYADKWHVDNLSDDINAAVNKSAFSDFEYSELVKKNVFVYSAPFSYSGINWGRINVGLSLEKYDQDISDLYSRTLLLAGISLVAGFIASIGFARKITKPVLELNRVSQIVAGGDLNASVQIKLDDELGRLAESFNNMTESLKNSKENLEKKVAERTLELAEMNRQLQLEIIEREQAESRLLQYNARLEAFDEIYRGIICAKSTDKILSETLNNFRKLFPLYNTALIVLHDNKTDMMQLFSNSNIMGADPNCITAVTVDENFAFLDSCTFNNLNKLNSSGKENLSVIGQILKEAGVNSFVTTLLLGDEQIIGEIIVGFDDPGAYSHEVVEVLLILANQISVAVSQTDMQSKIKEHTKILQNSLSEKEVLLKEIHHRVKNNLQVISSLLYLSSKKIKEQQALTLFKDSQHRVKSIALIHERLYQSKDLGHIDFNEYVQKLTNDLFRSYSLSEHPVKLNLMMDNVHINIDYAVPCGLILNELISNAFKYAFPDKSRTDCEIKVKFKKNNDNYILIVSDNGKGMPEGFSIKRSESLGLKLVETLTAQLEGSLNITSDKGTCFIITFKENIAKRGSDYE